MALIGTVNPGNSLGFKNVVINGDMSIWQRGTSFTAGDGIYTADRWYSYKPSITRQSNSDNGGFSLRWTYNSTAANYISQGIESLNCLHLRGKTVTLSFEVKTSSNFSSGKFYYELIENTSTADLNPNSVVQTISKSTETTTSFVRISRTYTLSSSFNNLYVSFYLDSATAGQWYEIRNVQLEEGSVATPFEKRSSGTELQLCQRYCYQSTYYASSSLNYGYADFNVYGPYSGTTNYGAISQLIFLNGSTDYIELYVQLSGTGALTVLGGANTTVFSGFLVRGA
jgi:hypothetical protein